MVLPTAADIVREGGINPKTGKEIPKGHIYNPLTNREIKVGSTTHRQMALEMGLPSEIPKPSRPSGGKPGRPARGSSLFSGKKEPKVTKNRDHYEKLLAQKPDEKDMFVNPKSNRKINRETYEKLLVTTNPSECNAILSQEKIVKDDHEYVHHPKTYRLIRVDGQAYKKVLKQCKNDPEYIKQKVCIPFANGEVKMVSFPNPRNKGESIESPAVLNPATGRYISINSAAYKSLKNKCESYGIDVNHDYVVPEKRESKKPIFSMGKSPSRTSAPRRGRTLNL